MQATGGFASPWQPRFLDARLALLLALAQRPGFLASPAGQDWIDDLAFLAGSEHDPGRSQEFLDRLGTIDVGSPRMMRAVVALARGRQRSGGSVRDLSQGKSAERMASLLTEAARITGSDITPQDRVVAIQLIGLANKDSARTLFPALLDARSHRRATGGVAGTR